MITISENDIVYAYKETYFTGFSPCFDHNIYSLACCKGNRNNGGMRRSICRNAAQTNKDIWILSIAGKSLDTEKKELLYSQGDIIYLAHVDRLKLFSWKDYSKLYSERQDMIYDYCNGEMIRNKKSPSIHPAKEDYIASDCGIGLDNYCEIEQIILTDTYYIFKPGLQICDTLDVKRGFSYNGNSRAAELKKIIKDAVILFDCKNPFAL